MKSFLYIVHFLFLIISISAYGQNVAEESSIHWWNGNVIEILVKENNTIAGHWNYTIYNPGDIHIEVYPVNDEPAGEMILLAGRFFLTKNLDLKEGYEIDSLDYAGLMLQLAYKLLTELYPEGPKEVPEEDNTWKIGFQHIELGTTSATAKYPRPWLLTGEFESNKSINFSISLKSGFLFEETIIEGKWDVKKLAAQLDDSTLVEGWDVRRLGIYTTSQSVDYTAQSSINSANTFGELRILANEKY